MLDLRKRVEKAAEGMLGTEEQVLAAVHVTASPIRPISDRTMVGFAAGGVLGAAVGAAVGKSRERAKAEQEAVGTLPDVASRPEVEPPIPRAGGVIGITTERVLVWSVSATGKPKELLHQFPLHDVDTVVWRRLEGGPGRPVLLTSVLLWIGLGSQVLAVAAVATGPMGHNAHEVVGALTDRRPGRVHEFTA